MRVKEKIACDYNFSTFLQLFAFTWQKPAFCNEADGILTRNHRIESAEVYLLIDGVRHEALCIVASSGASNVPGAAQVAPFFQEVRTSSGQFVSAEFVSRCAVLGCGYPRPVYQTGAPFRARIRRTFPWFEALREDDSLSILGRWTDPRRIGSARLRLHP